MRVFVIDFEGSLKCGVVEYGVVTLEHGEIVTTESGLCRPDEAQVPRDVLLHGLRDDVLKDQPSFSTLREQFVRYRRDGLLAAHHASVENAFLCRYWHTVPSGIEATHAYPSLGSWGPWVDSRILYHRLYGLADNGLMSLVREFELGPELETQALRHCPAQRRKPHCALYDALASALLLLRTHQREGLGLDEWVRYSQPSRDSDTAQSELF